MRFCFLPVLFRLSFSFLPQSCNPTTQSAFYLALPTCSRNSPGSAKSSRLAPTKNNIKRRFYHRLSSTSSTSSIKTYFDHETRWISVINSHRPAKKADQVVLVVNEANSALEVPAVDVERSVGHVPAAELVKESQQGLRSHGFSPTIRIQARFEVNFCLSFSFWIHLLRRCV